MAYISKNYSLNKTYFIEENAIHSIVKKIANETNVVKIENFTVNINPKSNSFKIFISLWTKNISEANENLRSFTKAIDIKCNELFSIKPSNILINIKGVL